MCGAVAVGVDCLGLEDGAATSAETIVKKELDPAPVVTALTSGVNILVVF